MITTHVVESKTELLSLTLAKSRVSDFVTFVSPGYYDKYYGLGDLNVDIFPDLLEVGS